MSILRASCHCGTVELHITDHAPFASASRCNCSFCRRRAAPNISVPESALTVVSGAEHLRLYAFGTETAQHYFCGQCGVYTHHRRRSDPREFGVNLGCIDGARPDLLEPMPWNDGINHPSDAD